MTTLAQPTSPTDDRGPFAGLDRRTLVSLGLVAAVILWIYGPEVAGLAVRWWKSQDYIHGFLVRLYPIIVVDGYVLGLSSYVFCCGKIWQFRFVEVVVWIGG